MQTLWRSHTTHLALQLAPFVQLEMERCTVDLGLNGASATIAPQRDAGVDRSITVAPRCHSQLVSRHIVLLVESAMRCPCSQRDKQVPLFVRELSQVHL